VQRSVVVVLVVLLMLIAGCSSKLASIVGKWSAQGGRNVIEFTDDGQITQNRATARVFTWYKIEGDQMTVGHVTSGVPDETVRFELSGDKLVIGTCLALGTMGATEFTRIKE